MIILIMKNNSKILGILGSGQLARMTAIAAQQYGYSVYIYCNDNQFSPAEHVATKTIKGDFNDLHSILDFCSLCDVVTLENEFIDQEILQKIDQLQPKKLFPDSETFKKIGDKISEKEHFQSHGIKVAPFIKVNSIADVLVFAEIHSFPLILKSAKGGYDGFGNLTIKNKDELTDNFSKLKGELLVEAFIPYEMECAIMVARNANDQIVSYPIAHTIQENHICHFVAVPAQIDSVIALEIEKMAIKAMKTLNAVGIFAFEFFITKDKDIYLNESAPRPHNSGHYSIEGCETSQFANHVRAVLNLPLGSPALTSKNILMLNLLGTQNGPALLGPLNSFYQIKKGYLHLYGKKESKIGRKMGHLTLLGEDLKQMEIKLKQLKGCYYL